MENGKLGIGNRDLEIGIWKLWIRFIWFKYIFKIV